MVYSRYNRLYKHSRRGYFNKRRWPIGGDLLTEKISRMHTAFDLRRTGLMATASWDGKTGTGLMHVFDLPHRVVQIRVIVRGYIYRIYRHKQARDFDELWYNHRDQYPDVVELVREFEQGRVAESG